ncbi:PRC-barrel domain-containing protein [Methylobacterium sp. J-076]|uniref:PRC-barrel domain-containing protein n=1 Tax=Methylobacterium sp. J-076 TaxID=2836655 RepID=UPI001FB8D1CA|nr:PRC-barrel domain-containing protein [Methylobacterium sp. J-076]MCJ2012331.1 PRC-barrel domain-containing protein [Methylobacterium sp. J-076]
MTSRSSLAALLPLLCTLASAPAFAQDATVIGKDTILPGTGPGTTTGGRGGGGLLQAGSVEDATKRQHLKPATFLASHMIGVEVRNLAGDSVGKINDLLLADGGSLKAVVIDVGGFLGIGSKQIAVEPDALVLRPGGDRFSAILQMSKDTISAAQAFDPAKAIPAQ